MKFTKPIITAAAAVGISVAMAATASAYSTVGKFGTYERLYDAGGAVVTAWTVDNLKPSTDRIPAYPLHGTLWEATATVEPVRGTVTPLIPNLNARADNGRNYHALFCPILQKCQFPVHLCLIDIAHDRNGGNLRCKMIPVKTLNILQLNAGETPRCSI